MRVLSQNEKSDRMDRGRIFALQVILASLPGVSELDEDIVLKTVSQSGADSALDPEITIQEAKRFARETIELARSIKKGARVVP